MYTNVILLQLIHSTIYYTQLFINVLYTKGIYTANVNLHLTDVIYPRM